MNYDITYITGTGESIMTFTQIKQSADFYGCHVRATAKGLEVSSPDYSKTKKLPTQEANATSAQQFEELFKQLSSKRIVEHWTGGDAA